METVEVSLDHRPSIPAYEHKPNVRRYRVASAPARTSCLDRL